MSHTHMLFIAEAKQVTLEGQVVQYYELNHGATIYRIGKAFVSEALATQYNYYQVDLSSPLAESGALDLFDALVPDAYVNAAKQCAEFKAWSFTDLAARVANGQVPVAALKLFLRVRYTVNPSGTPGEEDYDDGRRYDTLTAYEADASAGKVWGCAYIPHKWSGRDHEHME